MESEMFRAAFFPTTRDDARCYKEVHEALGYEEAWVPPDTEVPFPYTNRFLEVPCLELVVPEPLLDILSIKKNHHYIDPKFDQLFNERSRSANITEHFNRCKEGIYEDFFQDIAKSFADTIIYADRESSVWDPTPWDIVKLAGYFPEILALGNSYARDQKDVKFLLQECARYNVKLVPVLALLNLHWCVVDDKKCKISTGIHYSPDLPFRLSNPFLSSTLELLCEHNFEYNRSIFLYEEAGELSPGCPIALQVIRELHSIMLPDEHGHVRPLFGYDDILRFDLFRKYLQKDHLMFKEIVGWYPVLLKHYNTHDDRYNDYVFSSVSSTPSNSFQCDNFDVTGPVHPLIFSVANSYKNLANELANDYHIDPPLFTEEHFYHRFHKSGGYWTTFFSRASFQDMADFNFTFTGAPMEEMADVLYASLYHFPLENGFLFHRNMGRQSDLENGVENADLMIPVEDSSTIYDQIVGNFHSEHTGYMLIKEVVESYEFHGGPGFDRNERLLRLINAAADQAPLHYLFDRIIFDVENILNCPL